jgi:uncharacterized protein YggU (UPF0235/DUF167 family)
VTVRRFKLHDGKRGAAITVRLTPRARRTEFSGILRDGTLRVRVAASPEGGAANVALVDFLSQVLDVEGGRIEIVAGEEGLDKIVSILDMRAEEAQRRILSWMAAK